MKNTLSSNIDGLNAMQLALKCQCARLPMKHVEVGGHLSSSLAMIFLVCRSCRKYLMLESAFSSCRDLSDVRGAHESIKKSVEEGLLEKVSPYRVSSGELN